MIDKIRHSIPAWIWPHFLLSFLLPVYLYLSLFRFPFAPIYLDGDQTFFWEYALRMLHGEHIYRDFFSSRRPASI
jgi:hypothetical protein